MSLDSTNMAAAPAAEQARTAIAYMLRRISDETALGWYLNHTEAWAQLCQAYAALSGSAVTGVRKRFACYNAKDPKEEGRQEAIAAAMQGSPDKSRLANDDDDELSLDQSQILRALKDWSMVDRQELIAELLRDYCRACGGRTFIKPCGCLPVRRLGVRV